ncbi:MAG: class III extradiol dioxygenase subunit B-like domain-containing protein [Parcubacteria group bacterium]|jgi:aromatic ring-opening dioxygenase LigB subunit
MIRFSAITPHPPIIIPAIGRNDLNLCRKTVNAMKAIGEKFRAVKSETVVLISPHGPVQYDKFIINYSPILRGDLSQFGDNRNFAFENDRELVDEIASELRNGYAPVGFARELKLDHGALVPLHYLMNPKDISYNPKLIHMSFSMLPLDFHYRFGQIMGRILQASKKTVSIIASGDMSHRVTVDAPAGYSPQGRVFDKHLEALIKQKNIKGILNVDKDLVEEAGECGLRSVVMMLGAISELRWEIKSMSYEAPFGVGYLTASINIK